MPKTVIEIIVVGNELLDGRRLDSNSSWLGRKFSAMGAQVRYKQSINDSLDDMVSAFHLAYQRSNLVLVSGGLGPTSDDLTFLAIAKSFNEGLLYHPDIEDKIKQRFAARGRTYVESNRRQAMLPQSARVLDNDLGTAPGIWCEHLEGEKKVFVCCLPGVPYEMMHMFEQHVQDKVQQMLIQNSQTLKKEKIFSLAGVSESEFAEKIDLLFNTETAQNDFHIAYTASYPYLDVTLALYEDARATSTFEDTVKKFLQHYADSIVAEDGQKIESMLVKELQQKKLSISCAESCTGGLLAATLLNVSGASAVFSESLVCYSNASKTKHLQVSTDLLNTEGAVSKSCAMAMAQGQLKNSGADLALAVTGIAGPTGGSEEKPVGLVYIALAASDHCKNQFGAEFEEATWVKEFRFHGDREKNRLASVMEALRMSRNFVKCLKS